MYIGIRWIPNYTLRGYAGAYQACNRDIVTIMAELVVRDILHRAANEPDGRTGGLGTEMSALFSGIGLESEIAEICEHVPIPPDFDR